MFKKILKVGLGLGVVFATIVVAKPNMPRGDFEVKLMKIAGKKGMFCTEKENFPKDYFLVPRNLPFLVGLSLYHPKSSILNLSKKQIEQIIKIKNKTVPAVIKKVKKVKKLEFQLAKNIAINSNSAKSQYELVEKIAKLRTELTKAHLQCINDVRSILTKEQYEKLLKYATNSGANLHAKSSGSKKVSHELVDFIHAGMMVKLYRKELGITDKQTVDFANKIMMVFVPKIQNNMQKANKLEKLIRKGVYTEHKNIKQLKKYVDEVARLKKDVANYRIEAYLVLRNILSKNQFKEGMKILLKQQN